MFRISHDFLGVGAALDGTVQAKDFVADFEFFTLGGNDGTAKIAAQKLVANQSAHQFDRSLAHDGVDGIDRRGAVANQDFALIDFGRREVFYFEFVG